jgi:oxalate decarboxylase/phosphoglucose isomerase-like protein (cupin superfamily)
MSTLQIDNERVTITEWRFAANAQTGWHRHRLDYVIPEGNGALLIEAPDGSSSVSELTAHAAYFRKACVEHNVINASDGPFAFIEIELK